MSAAGPDLAISVVIVTHQSAGAVGATLAAVESELVDGDELIVADNASADGTPDVVRSAPTRARLIETGGNLGFPAACNRGAAVATADVLVFLNPDAIVQPGWRAAIAAPSSEHPDWGAWQALISSGDGTVLNATGCDIHFTGIAWARGAGAPMPSAAELAALSEPAFCSGACLAVRRDEFEAIGGFAGDYFLYHEDAELCLRLRLAGRRMGLAAEAKVDHDYDFDKGPLKWRMLERNRWATVIRTYPGVLLALLAPALLATELALVVVAAAGGWAPQKLLAWTDTVRSLPRLLRERRQVQALREIPAAEFARALTPDLDSAYLGAAARSGLLRILLRGYWRFVLVALGDGGRHRD